MIRSQWLRWTVRIGLAILALPVLLFIALFLTNPDGARLLGSLLIAPLVTNTRPPAMFADQPFGSRASDQETSQQLTARLQQQFPLGTTEDKLKQALLAQGFKPPPPPPTNCVPPVENGAPRQLDRPVRLCPPQDQRKSLQYAWGYGVCGATITVRWSTDAGGTVTLLDGYYYAACL
jgi:hypothetical protein